MIEVSVVPADAQTAIHIRIDPQSQMMIAQSANESPWPYGINIDNLLILDFNADKILSSFELMLPTTMWPEGNLSKLTQIGEGALKLRGDVDTSRYIEENVLVKVNKQTNLVELRLGNGAGGSLVQLSNQCYAILNGDNLVGFRIDLSENLNL